MIKKEKLKFLFVITVIIIIFNFYYFVREQSLNQYADWLINYQGGFVRRGLIGEIFYQIHFKSQKPPRTRHEHLDASYCAATDFRVPAGSS